MQFNIEGCEEKFSTIAKTIGISEASGNGVVEWIRDLNQRIGIPAQLRDIGVKPEHLDPLADLAIADFAHPNNPKPVSREQFRALYEAAY
jgi:alcohol dehydrogenase class IV